MRFATRAREWATDGTARRVRESAGLTAEQMADAIGVSRSSLVRWESGTRLPRTRAAARWGRILHAVLQPTYHLAGRRGTIPEV